MPDVFSDLVGQEHIIDILRSAVTAANAPQESTENSTHAMTHAWLFTGPPGSGRSSAAVAFAQALICPTGGCGACNECRSAKNSAHPDIEIIRTEGLSIKIDEVRELLTRTSWAPSMGGWRVVVMEDADRLTESAANALLKAIEEPGGRTVWLLCAPTLHDLLPTIRSRCRHLQLRTPSTPAVTNVLINRDGIAPEMADFAARVCQGHIGRARYLATNEIVRSNRGVIMKLPLQLTSIAAAYEAAQKLIDLATQEASAASEARDEKETTALQEAYGKGATGRGMATGASKAVKELEKEQKSRATRMVRDCLDGALLDMATFYRDVMLVQAATAQPNQPTAETLTRSLINIDMFDQINAFAHKTPAAATVKKINAIMETRINLSHNAAPLLTIEALMCRLA
jgi:DNA polymerase-3 subunit delta'